MFKQQTANIVACTIAYMYFVRGTTIYSPVAIRFPLSENIQAKTLLIQSFLLPNDLTRPVSVWRVTLAPYKSLFT